MKKALNKAFVPTMSKVKNGRLMDSDWIKKNLQGFITDEQLLEEIRTAIRRKHGDSDRFGPVTIPLGQKPEATGWEYVRPLIEDLKKYC